MFCSFTANGWNGIGVNVAARCLHHIFHLFTRLLQVGWLQECTHLLDHGRYLSIRGGHDRCGRCCCARRRRRRSNVGQSLNRLHGGISHDDDDGCEWS